ncbi:MAG: hypothetical protein IAX21_01165 [Candidatus Bathyarchaeota archaeon]|nr:hypothetical protein [Candidatus Bathyarchaeum tardum]WGM90422.1 MAG: hypothetical protein NUK63_04680 [Candidatus Bathyarchaeum tardum]WNZ29509.1 MAG: hypothetical protein IAX21_01165 [Candidatus Bathyarchaeota archaeon]
MPISKVFVVRFVQLLKGRRFAEAERVLERIKESTNTTEWNSGYIHALDGILLTQKSSDSYAFLANIDLDDEKTLRKSRKEFLKEYKNKVHQDFDRGFYAAWADFTLIAVREITNKEAKEPTPEIEEKSAEIEQ